MYSEEELQDMLQQAQEAVKGSKITLRSIKEYKSLDGLDLKSFEKSRVISDSKKKHSKLKYIFRKREKKEMVK